MIYLQDRSSSLFRKMSMKTLSYICIKIDYKTLVLKFLGLFLDKYPAYTHILLKTQIKTNTQ